MLRQHLERFFASAGQLPPNGTMADTDGAVRGLVASGVGAGVLRRDQAEGLGREGLARGRRIQLRP
jgi:DNA-binding transcriptional LysR family regulator